MSTAMVFPGMAPVRFADIGKFLILDPVARELVAEADDRLGYSLLNRMREDDADYTEYAQVGFFVACVALARWAERELGVEPTVVTGPSFGEKPLAAYVGSLSFADAVSLTAGMARCLVEYFAREHRDVVTHSFVRVPRETLDDALAGLDDWSEISCYVDHDFHMVSLRETHLDWLQRTVRAAGGLSLYTMRPPMHCAAFAPLRRKAEEEVIGPLTFAAPRLPVVSDQDGSLITTGEGVRTMLLDSIVAPLRWPAVVETLRGQGVERVCVAGPDSLFGRVALTRNTFEVLAANPTLAMRRPRVAVTS
jgi:[acyl-carrier-protein] S-malonyltransferase